MDNKDDEALPCGSMPRYKGNRFISDELHLQEQQQTDVPSNYSMFKFLPNLPLNFLFGRFSNVIPEETDDADRKNSPGKDNKPSISEEVKKLGLTAEIKPENNDDKKFEPYWVEIKPRVRSGHLRRNSATQLPTEKTKMTVPSVDDNSSIEGVYTQPSSDVHAFKESMSKDTEMDRDVTDFSGIKYIPEKNATNTALENKDSVICRRGEIFRRNAQDELTADVTHLRLGRMFRPRSGMRRSSSLECLQKIQTDLKISDSSNNQKDNLIDADKETCIRRTSSTGSLQKLQSMNAFHSIESLETSSNADTESSETWQKINDFPYSESEDETFASPMTEKVKSLGTQSVKWATTSKVRQTKREQNMFSPTSF